MKNADFSFHQEQADAEIEAACRCTELEETELHLRLALYHLERNRDPRFERTLALSQVPASGRHAFHTDKEG